MNKKLWIAACLVALIGVVVICALASLKGPPPSASLSLPDGSSVRIVAVTFGTNHVIGSSLARLNAKFPIIGLLTRSFSSSAQTHTVTTPKPELVVWLERMTNGVPGPMTNGSYFWAYLADGSHFVSGSEAMLDRFSPGTFLYSPQSLQFQAFPRRDPEITLCFYQLIPGNAGMQPCGSLSFHNPVYRAYGQWQPESLPAIRRVDNLEAKLSAIQTDFDDSGGLPVTGSHALRTGGRNVTLVDLDIRSLTDTNEVWGVSHEEVSDATGNQVSNNMIGQSGINGSFDFMPSLWTNEAAWKLKIEMKRKKGFKPQELLNFANVPLGTLNATNLIGWTTNCNGATVTLDHIVRRPAITTGSWSSDTASAVQLNLTLPAGRQFDLISATLDTGEVMESISSSTDNTRYTYNFKSIPGEAKTVSFVFAVQKSKIVEFMVKPTLH